MSWITKRKNPYIIYPYHYLTHNCLCCIYTVFGSDYNITDATSVVFNSISTGGSEECINITISDDNLLEGTHSFTVNIVNVISAASIGIGPISTSATVIISDNDCEYTCL